VVEQGFRYDLEAEPAFEVDNEGVEGGVGEFREMLEAQRKTGGFLPEKSPLGPVVVEEKVHALLDEDDDEETSEPMFNLTVNMKHQSLARPALRPLTLGNWMFDVVADLTASSKPAAAVVATREAKRVSRFVPIPAEAFTGSMAHGRRPSSVQVMPWNRTGTTTTTTTTVMLPQAAHTVASRRFSLQFTPTSPTFSMSWSASKMDLGMEEHEEEEFEKEKREVEKNGSRAIGSRRAAGVRKRWDDVKISPLTSVKVDPKINMPSEGQDQEPPRPVFWAVVREIFPMIPYKPLLFLGLFTCLASGAMTPLFSFLLSRLLFEVSTGAHDVSTINFFGGIVLGIAALDGVLMGLKYFLMETAGNAWVLRIRRQGFANVLAQDKRWFDKGENAAGVRVVQTIVKDGDDARDLVSVVMGQGCVVVAMVGVGLLWAVVRGWQLTLVGVAVAPVFAGVMALQATLVARCEIRNKRAREDVAKGYYGVRLFFVLFFFVLGAEIDGLCVFLFVGHCEY